MSYGNARQAIFRDAADRQKMRDDFNANGVINDGDLNELALHWRESIPFAASAVSEPVAATLSYLRTPCPPELRGCTEWVQYVATVSPVVKAGARFSESVQDLHVNFWFRDKSEIVTLIGALSKLRDTFGDDFDHVHL